MNVNSTPPVEPGKVTTVGKSGTVGTEAAGAESSGGFFAQLHALIFGSKTASDEIAVATIGTANAEGKSAADVLIESESESIPAVEADDALANVVDIDLLSDAELSEAGQQTVQKAQSSAQDKNTSSKAVQERKVDDTATAPVPASIAKWVAKQDPASDEMASHELQRKTAQAMSDGDQLLGRLQEANQTLNKPNGKTLPIQHGQALEPQNIEQIEAKSSSFAPPQTLPEDATVSANYVGNMSAAPQGEDNKAQDELMAAALFGGAIAGATAAQGETSTAVVQEMVADPALTASTLAKPEAALVGNKLTTQGESTSNLTNVTVLATGEVANPATAGVENGKVTIPWTQVPTEAELASLPPELKDQLMEGGKNRPHTAHLQAQSMAQGVTPAQLAAQQAATTPVPNNPANVTSVDMAAVVPQAVMTNPASTVNPELAASSAMLAALGGNALVGKDDRRVTNESGHDGLAQQIAAAAGQGIGQHQALQRAEAQAVQANAMPLHLNKEMAADQLAERVQMMLSKNLKNIDIRLDPPEMGRMHIRMNMQGDSATVHFTVTNQHARDALEQTMPRLREMLAQQGVQLGDTFVQQQSAGQQQRYSGQEQSGFGQSARNGKHNSEENLDTDVKLDLNVATKRDGISYYA